ncbi:MAG: CmpA/NrtA family ABC transporter substrate-binding protein [Glaciecola sp.]
MNNTSYPTIQLGFVKLTDAAPYVVAKELGFFAQYGLSVELRPQNSWTTLRDKLETGLLDAAQMLAPMPLASALGISGARRDIITPLITSQNGNGITLSMSLCNEIKELSSLDEIPFPMPAFLLKKAIESRKSKQQNKLTFASVFPFSCHYLQLLDYFSAGDINTDDVEFVFMPPTSMADSLDSADIDGFCVGGPYNATSVRKHSGATVATSYDIWQDQAEKVLGITNEAYQQRPNMYHLLCAALIDACEWLKDVPNRFEAARILADEHYLDTAIDYIAPSLIGSCLTSANTAPRHIPHYNRFSSVFANAAQQAYSVNRPSHVQGEWLLSKVQMAWPHLCKQDVNTSLVSACFREDIFKQALASRLHK